MKRRRFFIYTFGCRVNQAESESLAQKFIQKGFIQDADDPDIFVINSCAVTHRAVAETRKLINKVKREKRSAKIVLTGCSANYWIKTGNEDVLKKLDIVVDNLQKDFLVEILLRRLYAQDNLFNENKPKIRVDKYQSSGRLLIKIQDGCHRFCSFCIVPYLRGLPKSYKISDILKVIRKNDWAKEAILTAINTEAFGKDTGESFLSLIRSVLLNTKVQRLSFGSIHPWSIDSEFVSFYKNEVMKDFRDRFVHFFHIPVQSGSDMVLRLMKRGYRAKEILERVYELKKINPYIYFGTDVIVGFPGETESDFRQTYEFLQKSPFVKFHIFRYSSRKHTAAYYMQKRLEVVPEDTKKKRARLLAELESEKIREFQKKLIGRKFSALVLNSVKNGLFSAVLDNQYPVLLYCSHKDIGKIIEVKIVKTYFSKLMAEKT